MLANMEVVEPQRGLTRLLYSGEQPGFSLPQLLELSGNLALRCDHYLYQWGLLLWPLNFYPMASVTSSSDHAFFSLWLVGC